MKIVKHPLFFTGILLVTLLLGWQIGRDSTPPTTNGQWLGASSASDEVALQDSTDLSLFWTALQALKDNYIFPDRLKPKTLVEGAIRGLVESLDDPYTVFMTAQQSDDFRSVLVGQLQGIGAELDLQDGEVVVVSPLKGSPAEKAGLLAGDIIEQIDDQSIEGLTLNDVVHKIRGAQGTAVILTITRGDKPSYDVTITRDAIHIPSVESGTKETDEGKIGIITLNQFGDSSTSEFTDALSALLQQKVAGLIIDLRNNGGGYLEGATEIAELFAPKGSLIVSVEHHDTPTERHLTKKTPLAPDLPIVVLVNQGTASAAEILSGALQDEGRATLVGVKTFGKGTVQDVIDLPGGSSIKITTARWLTPKGRDIGADRIMPDIVVERTSDDITAGRDPQMDKALTLFGTEAQGTSERGDE